MMNCADDENSIARAGYIDGWGENHMSDGWNIALLGATGAVGTALLELLQEREFPIGALYPLASERSAGE